MFLVWVRGSFFFFFGGGSPGPPTPASASALAYVLSHHISHLVNPLNSPGTVGCPNKYGLWRRVFMLSGAFNTSQDSVDTATRQ